MTVMVGQQAPTLECEAWLRGADTATAIALDDFRGRWVVLFFYPRDFTFICPTEIAAFADLDGDFATEDAVVVGASTDSFHSHKAWFESDARLADVDYPVLADTSHRLARAYGVLLDNGEALRGTFIVDPHGILRHASVSDLEVGRNPAETLRVLQALKTGERCPVNWRPGLATLGAAA